MPPPKKYLVDIYERDEDAPMPERPVKRPNIRIYRTTNRWIIGFGLVFLVVGGVVGFYMMRAQTVRTVAATSLGVIYGQMHQIEDSFSHFDLPAVQMSFDSINAEIDTITLEANKYGALTVARFAGVLIPPLRSIATTLAALHGLSDGALTAGMMMNDIKRQAFGLIINKQGEKLIQQLQSLNIQLTQLAGHITTLGEQGAAIGQPVSERLLAFQSELDQDEKITASALKWLNAPATHHLLLLIQNPSHITPAGGSIGAYADLAISNGNLTGIEVHGISDVGSSSLQFIPPKPLQLNNKNWDARNANWFFTFPLSGKKISAFLNGADIYKQNGIMFDGTIAVNPSVLYGIFNLSDENRSAVQSELNTGTPKVLTAMIPLMFEKMASLPSAEQDGLLNALGARVRSRDIMASFSDTELQGYITTSDAGGDIAPADGADVTDYLAVVNGNVGVTASDASIRQTVTLKSQINSAGEISDSLTVTRAKPKTTNKNYLQIFTPAGTKISGAEGYSVWPVIPKYDYTGYPKDPDIEAMEQSRTFISDLRMEQFSAGGKQVFAGYLTTPANESRTVKLQYTNTANISERKIYTYSFISDIQSGADSAFSFSVDAPPAYKWKESGTPHYEYHTDHSTGRIVINLTLLPV